MKYYRSMIALIAGLLIVILAIIFPSVEVVIGLAGPDQDSPQTLMNNALEKANDAGSFQMSISLDQTVRQENPYAFLVGWFTAILCDVSRCGRVGQPFAYGVSDKPGS